MGFFLHIPFPPPDIFFKLPWRSTVLHALLRYDLIGFQTMRDRRNFIQCLRLAENQVVVQGKGVVVSVTAGAYTTRVGNFPISIDYGNFARQAASADVAKRADELLRLQPQRTLILGVDRLDYTKGIPHRLQAFRTALDRYPELRERISLIQVVVPSRVDIPQYFELKSQIERLVGEINGTFMLAQQPQAMQLRFLQTLSSIAGDKSNTIVFPVPVDIITPIAEAITRTRPPRQ